MAHRALDGRQPRRMYSHWFLFWGVQSAPRQPPERILLFQILRSQKDGRAGKQLKLTGVVHVLLVQVSTVVAFPVTDCGHQARGVMAMDSGTSSDPYCKVTLGKEKQRSKVTDSQGVSATAMSQTIKNTLNPKWREAIDLNWWVE